MKEPVLDEIRKALFQLDNYCFGMPTRGIGTDVSFRKNNGSVCFAIDFEAKRWPFFDHHKRDTSEFIKILQDAGVKDVGEGVSKGLSAIILTVPCAQSSAALFKKALKEAVRADTKNNLLKAFEIEAQKARYYLGGEGSPVVRNGLKDALNKKGIGVDMRGSNYGLG